MGTTLHDQLKPICQLHCRQITQLVAQIMIKGGLGLPLWMQWPFHQQQLKQVHRVLQSRVDHRFHCLHGVHR